MHRCTVAAAVWSRRQWRHDREPRCQLAGGVVDGQAHGPRYPAVVAVSNVELHVLSEAFRRRHDRQP